jgi:hypothetical protein
MKMVRGLQLMYTPAATSESTGYQFVAETPGIQKEEKDMVERYSTTSGPLTEGKNFSRATSVYKLPTGRVAISRLANIGVGYDGRPDAICTHTLVLSPEDYSGLFGHLSWISEALRPDPSVRGSLPMLDLPVDVGLTEIDPSALSAWAPDRNQIAIALSALLQGKHVIIEGAARAQDPLAGLEVLLSLLPRWRREQISLCTFDVTVNRPFDLLIVPEAVIAEGAPKADCVVVKLRGGEASTAAVGPYVSFAVGAAYERKWSTRTAFLRFYGTLSRGTTDIDASWLYWDKLENAKPPSDPLALASYEADLAILSASVAPDRSTYHLGQAIARCTETPSVELATKILFDAIPALGPSTDAPGLASLTSKTLQPIAERRDAKTLAALLREGVFRVKVVPQDPTMAKIIENIGLSLFSCADARGEGPGPEFVEPFSQAFDALEGQPQWRDLQERFIMAIAAKAGTANPSNVRLTANRLKNFALSGTPGPRTPRLLAMAARLFHDINDGAGEAKVEVARFALNLAEHPVPQLEPVSVDPEIFHTNIPAPPKSPAKPAPKEKDQSAESAPKKSPPEKEADSPSPKPAAAKGSTPEGKKESTSKKPSTETASEGPSTPGEACPIQIPLPPSSREALDLFKHIAGHSGTAMGPVILSISNAFCSASRATEGLLWIEAVADLPGSKEWEEALFEGSLKLCDNQHSPKLPPSLALRTYWRLALRGPPPNTASVAAWGERLHGSLSKWTELSVESPPLTVWDVVLAAGIPTVFLQMPPPDLTSWGYIVRKSEHVILGAEGDTLRAAMTDVLDSLKAGMGREGESTGSFMDRMRKRLRANPYEPPYVLVLAMRDLIPHAEEEAA